MSCNFVFREMLTKLNQMMSENEIEKRNWLLKCLFVNYVDV